MADILNFLLLSFIITLFILYGKFLYSRTHLYKCARTLPRLPGTLPIVGDILMFTGDFWKALEKIRSLTNENGIISGWLGPKLMIMLSNPKYIALIINKELEKDEYIFDILERSIGNSIPRAPVSIWKQHMKIISPAFCQKNLNKFVEVFAKYSETLVNKWSSKIGKGEFDVLDDLIKFSLDTICQTMMGVTVNSMSDESNVFYRSTIALQEIILKRVKNLWLRPDFLYDLSKYAKQERDLLKIINSFFDDVVNKKVSSFKEQIEYEDGTNHKDVLDRLMESQSEKKLTLKKLKDECNSIISGGFETSGTTESFLLLIFGCLPRIQDKVVEELNEIYGHSTRSVTVEDLPKMKYIERVILETLRLFPIAPVILRKITKDVKIEKYIFPAGCSCAIDIYKMHRDEKIWGENESEFGPDRFLPENSINRHPNSFFAFSGGSRGCIGRRYGMMSIKVFVATILRYYKISSTEDYKKIDVMMNIFMKTRNGFMVSIEPRKNN